VNVGANSNAAGNAGNVVVDAPIFELLEGSRLSSSAASTGNGGSILIRAPTRMVLAGSSNPGDPVHGPRLADIGELGIHRNRQRRHDRHRGRRHVAVRRRARLDEHVGRRQRRRSAYRGHR
jgi:hypothetical protein